ncbi:MAG: hypothetical protein ABL930_12405, partial [Pseudobdellovibrio sp.]
DSYWQAISLSYSKGLDVLGAGLSLNFIKQYPEDKRKLDALKEAAKTYIDSGNIKLAINTLKDLSQTDHLNSLQHQEVICDLLKVSLQLAEARKCYKNVFSSSDKAKKVGVLAKMMKTFEEQSGTEYQELQNQILSSNIEPFATEILILQAQKLLEQKNYIGAFNLSLKINARPVEADIRAEARLIQARILEQEFINQSVKTNQSKFSLVVAMKTEKMDKAFTAYSSAIKMSKTDSVQLRGLQGIDRIYTHFIDSLNNMPLPESLSAGDKKSLKSELVQLTLPFAEKRKNNNQSLKQISKLSASEDHDIVWDEYSIENSIEPRIKYPEASKLKNHYPTKTPDFNSLLKNRKFAEAEKIALEISSTKEKRAQGLYYLGLIAEAQGEYDKSLWMLEKAGQIENSALVNYAKAKVLFSVKDINTSLDFFAKVFDIREQLSEVRIVYAIKCFSDGDYIKASDEFSRLSAEQIYTYGVDILHIDSVLLKGDSVAALKLADTYSSYKADRLDLLLEQARIYEYFAVNKETASLYYQKALKQSGDIGQQVWLKKKIEFIKNNKNNQLTSYVGGK